MSIPMEIVPRDARRRADGVCFGGKRPSASGRSARAILAVGLAAVLMFGSAFTGPIASANELDTAPTAPAGGHMRGGEFGSTQVTAQPLTSVTIPATVITPDPIPEPTPPPPPPPPPSVGDVMVGIALAYLGYPYVPATAGPSSFDCSGFTNWVVLNATGRDIGRGLESQTYAGYAVSWGELLPGDLVFFANTYRPGLSHVGIYIGNGQFIHAENQRTGVVISSLGSEYYSSRYYGAVRIS